MNPEKHVTLLGGLMIAYGILGAIGIVVILVVFGIGAAFVQDAGMAWLTTGFGVGLAGLITITELPAILAGWGLIQRKSWARTLTLVLAAVNIIEIPLGTALGIYALYVLLKEETVRYLEGTPMTSG